MSSSVHVIHRGYDYRFGSTFAAEIIGLFILFVMWLVGAAIATVCCIKLPSHRIRRLYSLPHCRRSGEIFTGATSSRHAVSSLCWLHLHGWAGSSFSSCLSSVSPLRPSTGPLGILCTGVTILVQVHMPRTCLRGVCDRTTHQHQRFVDPEPLFRF